MKRTLSQGQAAKIQAMTYRDLVQAIESGKVSEKQLREYYSDARSKEMKRIKSFEKASLLDEYQIPQPRKLKNIVGIRDLVSEIADVNKELNKKKNTVTGYRKQRRQTIEKLNEYGIPVNEGNFKDWGVFMQWFHHSSWNMVYDSDSPETISTFEEAPAGPSGVWESLMENMQEEMRE